MVKYQYFVYLKPEMGKLWPSSQTQYTPCFCKAHELRRAGMFLKGYIF